MSHKFLLHASTQLLLVQIDQELFESTRAAGCPFCNGPLHRANYPRSPCGLPESLREYYRRRYSFTCGRCRKRTSSPTVRFFGRRWFPAPLLLLISALNVGANEGRIAQLNRLFGVVISESTWKRWRIWWRDCFPTTSYWMISLAQFLHTLPIERFPRGLFLSYSGGLQPRLISVLNFLAPITAGAFRAV